MTEFYGKRLLILGGSIQCLKVVEAAKNLGVYTIVTDLAAHKQVKEIADQVIPFSVTDFDSLFEWCKANPVDGVLNYCIDYSQHTHQRLCEEFGFPCYGNADQYQALTDKTLFKQICLEHDVDIIPEYHEDALEDIEYPVLVKPAESSGSRGVTICDSKESLQEAIHFAKTESRNGKVILEKFMGNKKDFTVTFLVIEGQPYLIRIGDRHLGKREDGLDRQCVSTTSPSIHTQLYFNNVHDRVVRMIKSIGVKNGPVFLQGFIDGDKCRFYDPGIRFPGGEYDRLFLAATGINLMEVMVGYALNGKISVKGRMEDAYLLCGKIAVQLTMSSRPGKICEYGGLDEIEALKGVVCVARKAYAGKIIPASGDVKQRIVEIDFLADDYHCLSAMIKQIYEKLCILDEHGKDMLVSKFNGVYVE